MNNNYSEWLKEMMHLHRLNGVELSAELKGKGVGMSQQYISNLRRGPMSENKARDIALAMNWPLPSLDNQLSTRDNVAVCGTEEVKPHQSRTITLTTLQPSAGNLTHNHENEVLDTVKVSTEWLWKTYPGINNLSNLALFSCKGDSMCPTFSQEDTLLANRGYNEFQEDGIYIFTFHDQLLVKRIQPLPGKGYQVLSDNPLYPPYLITPSDQPFVTVHAKLVGKFSFSMI